MLLREYKESSQSLAGHHEGAAGTLVGSNNLMSLIATYVFNNLVSLIATYVFNNLYHRLPHTPEIYDLKVFKAGDPLAGGSENLVCTKIFCM